MALHRKHAIELYADETREQEPATCRPGSKFQGTGVGQIVMVAGKDTVFVSEDASGRYGISEHHRVLKKRGSFGLRAYSDTMAESYRG